MLVGDVARDAARVRARARAHALGGQREHPHARPARDAGDRRRRLRAAALHAARAAAVAADDHARPHHVLDLLRDGGGAGAAGVAAPGGRAGGDGPRAPRGCRRCGSWCCPRCGRRSSPPALLIFALSFDDFVLSFFTTGESPQPLPVRIWSAIRFGVTPTINAIGTLMLAISAVAIGARGRCCRGCSGGARAGSAC